MKGKRKEGTLKKKIKKSCKNCHYSEEPPDGGGLGFCGRARSSRRKPSGMANWNSAFRYCLEKNMRWWKAKIK